MAVLIGAVGVVAVPIAFAAMAFIETLLLAAVLTLRLRERATGQRYGAKTSRPE
jgi:hypothetical protein